MSFIVGNYNCSKPVILIGLNWPLQSKGIRFLVFVNFGAQRQGRSLASYYSSFIMLRKP